VSFLYLILVIWVSYKSQLATSIFVAIASFLLINFFYVEPRYTFVIGSIESWSALLGFLLISIAITSLVHQLKGQKDIAEKETFKANLLRAIIEIFSVETDSIVALQKFCLLLKRELGCEVAILKLDPTTKDSIELASSRPGEVKLDFWYLSHAIENLIPPLDHQRAPSCTCLLDEKSLCQYHLRPSPTLHPFDIAYRAYILLGYTVPMQIAPQSYALVAKILLPLYDLHQLISN
jgi:hypothetical protein